MMGERESGAGFDAGALQAEISGYHRLIDVLGKEQDALRSAVADDMTRIATAKQCEVQALGRLAAARSRAVPVPAHAAGWDELRNLAEQAQRINAANGVMIRARQCYVDRTLAALHGAAGRSPVYGADGRRQLGMSSRPIAAI